MNCERNLGADPDENQNIAVSLPKYNKLVLIGEDKKSKKK